MLASFSRESVATKQIYAYSLRPIESGFQLQCQLGGFGFARGKGMHESAKLCFRDRSEKLYAGQTRRGE